MAPRHARLATSGLQGAKPKNGETTLVTIGGVNFALGPHETPDGDVRALSSLNETYKQVWAINSTGELEGVIPLPLSTQGLGEPQGEDYLAIRGAQVHVPAAMKSDDDVARVLAHADIDNNSEQIVSLLRVPPSGTLRAPEGPTDIAPPASGAVGDDDEVNEIAEGVEDMGLQGRALWNHKVGRKGAVPASGSVDEWMPLCKR